ncbi:zwei Ig domain protein zig-8-like isoform X2 [Pectinophora gossypiella]|uniref:zwei Ig domain protein zig-8-like isoform X2 n=1 Tax=Pectinophora gossypiella TaxID=13191 RepID=UPI00214EADB7|nr:zwei Ig domain protein zig-8-like isoform X2 [Pectinophora gossypiella]
MRARSAAAHLALLVLAHLYPPGVCDVAGGAGSVNALPAGAGAAAGRLAPSFDAATPRNVTALVGKSAYLSCRVRNLGNRTVSWIRHRDLHILTVGGYTYTSDQRFQATHSPPTDDWTLHIKWAQQRDAGVYECQVSTQPVRSFFVTLHVVDVSVCEEQHYQRMLADQVPSARILGGPDLHVDIGSTINLTCLIQFSPEPPAYIFWYHEEEVISYDSSRGGVSVVTEKGAATTSYLLVQDAAPADSGRYSCSPSNAEVASVRVHVLNGERPAAMQTGSAGLSNSSRCILALLLAGAAHARLLRALLNS